MTNNNQELSNKVGFEEADFQENNDKLLNDSNSKEKLETLKKNNTNEVKHNALDLKSKEDILNLYNSEENKDDNEKDWDALEKQYGDVEVKVVEDLDTLYQEDVLNKQ